jgi:hypothetical protein
LPLPAECTDLRLAASDTSDQRDQFGGRDGQCGSPRYPLLVCAGPRRDRSDDRATLDGLKLFRLSRAWINDPARLRSFIAKSEPDRLVRCSDRCPSPPGFPRVPLQRRSRAAYDAGMIRYLRPLSWDGEIDTAISKRTERQTDCCRGARYSLKIGS